MIPWRNIFRRFAEDYGWGPERVLSLTFYQIRMYLTDERAVKTHASRAAAERYREKIKKRNAEIIDSIVARVRYR